MIFVDFWKKLIFFENFDFQFFLNYSNTDAGHENRYFPQDSLEDESMYGKNSEKKSQTHIWLFHQKPTFTWHEKKNSTFKNFLLKTSSRLRRIARAYAVGVSSSGDNNLSTHQKICDPPTNTTIRKTYRLTARPSAYAVGAIKYASFSLWNEITENKEKESRQNKKIWKIVETKHVSVHSSLIRAPQAC